MQRAIKLMADHDCWPLWYSPVYVASIGTGNKIVVRPQDNHSEDEVGCVDPQTLPLSTETVARLTAWQDTFDASLNREYPPDGGLTAEASARFDAEGFTLWQTLIDELPEYQVVYHPASGRGVLIDPAHPDISYEFDYAAFVTRK